MSELSDMLGIYYTLTEDLVVKKRKKILCE
jgi:hypothetical protein